MRNSIPKYLQLKEDQSLVYENHNYPRCWVRQTKQLWAPGYSERAGVTTPADNSNRVIFYPRHDQVPSSPLSLVLSNKEQTLVITTELMITATPSTLTLS